MPMHTRLPSRPIIRGSEIVRDRRTMHFAVGSSRCAGEGAADDPQLKRYSREDFQHGEEDLHRAAFTVGEFDSVSTAEVQVERGHYLYRVRSL